MKEFCALLLLLFVIKIVGSSPPDADPTINVKYHGSRRYWTSVDSNGKTYLALNVLMEAVSEPVKLLFLKDKNMAQILSDITLYSPSNTEDECLMDTNKLEFKLTFDNENWIRGEVQGELNGIVVAFLYTKCPDFNDTRAYFIYRIDEKEENLEHEEERLCFKRTNPFHSSVDRTKNVMELQVTSIIPCKVFLILPNYMDVEDEELQPATRELLNETFAAQGEEFWWRSGNNDSLSDGIFFLGRDVVIDITKSTKAIPYFLRIGKNQPYPSLEFKFDANCSNQQYELFVNLRSDENCKIIINLGEDGINFITRGTVSTEIYDPTKSPIFVFARNESKVYVKAGTHLSIIEMDVCQIENPTDVLDDQFVIQITPSRGYTVCNTAQVLLPAGDIKGKIEVLLDRDKAAKLFAEAKERDASTSAAATAFPNYSDETTEVEKAPSEYWWIVIGVVLSVVALILAITAICFCVHHLRKQNEISKTQLPPNLNNDQNVENLHPTPKTETAIPIEEPLPKIKTSPATTPIQQPQD